MIRGPKCIVVATEVDHVVATHLGGADWMANAQSACKPCHSDKAAHEAGLLVDSVVPQQDSVVLAVNSHRHPKKGL